MDAGEDLGSSPRVALGARSMAVSHGRERCVRSPAVRQDGGTWFYVGLDEAGQGGTRGIRDHLQAYPTGGPARDLDGSHHERFVEQLPARSEEHTSELQSLAY